MKILQLVLILFIFGVAAAVPFVFNAVIFNQPAQSAVVTSSSDVRLVNGVQVVNVRGLSYGYSVNSFQVKKGVPVRIMFSAEPTAGCGRQFIMQAFGINVVAPEGSEVPVEFTPDKEGVFNYRCSMNMFRGQMTVTA